MANKLLIPGVTTLFGAGSLLNTMNPISGLYKAKDYVPRSLVDMFNSNNSTKKLDVAEAAKAAHVTAKTMAAVGTGALLAWLLRTMARKTLLDKINMANVTPGKDLHKIYRRPYSPALHLDEATILKLLELRRRQLLEQRRKAQLDKKLKKDLAKSAAMGVPFTPPTGSGYNTAKIVLPSALLILTALAINNTMDKKFDQEEADRLAYLQQALRQQINLVAVQRAKRNRGIVDQPQGQVKIASSNSLYGSDRLESSLGLLSLILFVTSVGAGYAWSNDRNKQVLLYKARKKGLLAYTKAKLALDRTYQMALDPALADALDANLNNSNKKAPLIANYKESKVLDFI